jgi:hypothetical protein
MTMMMRRRKKIMTVISIEGSSFIDPARAYAKPSD